MDSALPNANGGRCNVTMNFATSPLSGTYRCSNNVDYVCSVVYTAASKTLVLTINNSPRTVTTAIPDIGDANTQSFTYTQPCSSASTLSAMMVIVAVLFGLLL
eukprot:TRINITY_DN2351_c0_g1_i4.p1 TRINITY_DN2351_c0_g1~~TRINITY_DN2351_c0_g1_i4.p1  ORF type:complete len:103 (-),score=46.25 TRINITY_DN2351_c0_g1_i4:48-356(-)